MADYPTLDDAWAAWHAWSTRAGLLATAAELDAEGNGDSAVFVRKLAAEQRPVTALEALAAQRHLAAGFAERMPITEQRALDDGATPDDVANVADSRQERADWLDDEPVPYVLTDRAAPAGEETGLTGAEGPVLTSGPALSAEDAARALAQDGRPLDEARALVRAYQDDVSARLGTPVHTWGLDGSDLTCMTAPSPIPQQRGATDVEADRRAELTAYATSDAETVDEPERAR